VIDNFYKRASFRMNLDNKVSDRVTWRQCIILPMATTEVLMMTLTGVVTNAISASPLMHQFIMMAVIQIIREYQASWLSDNPVKSAKEIKEAYTTNYRL